MLNKKGDSHAFLTSTSPGIQANPGQKLNLRLSVKAATIQNCAACLMVLLLQGEKGNCYYHVTHEMRAHSRVTMSDSIPSLDI